MNNHYVYAHYFNGLLFYIGEGSGNRYKQVSNRHKSYKDYANKLTHNDLSKIDCKILVDSLTIDNAYALETFLIDLYIDQGIKLANIRQVDIYHSEYRDKHKNAINEGIAARRERGGYKLTTDQLTKITALVAAGTSKINIAKQLGVSRSTVYYYLNKGI